MKKLSNAEAELKKEKHCLSKKACNSFDSWEPFNSVKKPCNLDVTGLETMFLGRKYMVASHL